MLANTEEKEPVLINTVAANEIPENSVPTDSDLNNKKSCQKNCRQNFSEIKDSLKRTGLLLLVLLYNSILTYTCLTWLAFDFPVRFIQRSFSS